MYQLKSKKGNNRGILIEPNCMIFSATRDMVKSGLARYAGQLINLNLPAWGSSQIVPERRAS